MSVYDKYWEDRINEISELMEDAIRTREPSTFNVTELRNIGNRENWSATITMVKGNVRWTNAAHGKSLAGCIISHKIAPSNCRLEIRENENDIWLKIVTTGDQGEITNEAPDIYDFQSEQIVTESEDPYIQIHILLQALALQSWPLDTNALPMNGIYFFYENGEQLSGHPGPRERIVRVGINRDQGNFPSRIKNHYTGSMGNSVFRKHLGTAICNRSDRVKNTQNCQVEDHVSQYAINNLSFRCFSVEDRDERSDLEKRLIATLASSETRQNSCNWLGRFSVKEEIRESRLWNVHHVNSPDRIEVEHLARLRELTGSTPTPQGHRAEEQQICHSTELSTTCENKESLGKVSDRQSLFLIPCSSGKRENGGQGIWDQVRNANENNSFTFLDDHRAGMFEFYIRQVDPNGLKYYKRGTESDPNTKARKKALRKNKRLEESPTMMAIERYTGQLYQSLDDEVKQQLRIGSTPNVLIVSALMGLLAPTDLIPDYDLMMGDAINLLGKTRSVGLIWKEEFTDQREYVVKSLRCRLPNLKRVYMLLNRSEYAKAIRPALSGVEIWRVSPTFRGVIAISQAWGRLLNEALHDGRDSHDEIVTLTKKYHCKLIRL